MKRTRPRHLSRSRRIRQLRQSLFGLSGLVVLLLTLGLSNLPLLASSPPSQPSPTVSSSPGVTPVANPLDSKPPAVTPPEVIAPQVNPPTSNSPVANPPVANPPVANPPIANPPASHPPAVTPPKVIAPQVNPSGSPNPVVAPKTKANQGRNLTIPSQFKGQTIKKISLTKKQKVIALTFDDGPWSYTQPVLEILKRERIKASFFFIGKHLQLHPQLAKQVVAEGHAIGNHTWSHRYIPVDPATAAAEIDNTAARTTKLTGVKPLLFRPPAGVLDNGLVDYAQRKQYATVLWSVDPRDTRPGVTPQEIIDHVLQQVKPGGIILLHDGGGDRTATVKALPIIIRELRQQGYQFVTLPALMSLNQPAPKPAPAAPPKP